MTSLDDLGLHEAITLYYEKRDALRKGDMNHLLAIKRKCPDLFDKDKEAQVCEVIQHALIFQKSSRFRELKKAMFKEKFSVLTNEVMDD